MIQSVGVPSPITFPALVGQESMKLALLLNAVDPGIGGVLIRGERGTGKSTAVRALARVLPDVDVVAGCPFGCAFDEPAAWCAECRARTSGGERLVAVTRPMRVVELPVNASEDRVVGSIDVERAVRHGEKRFQPGILAAANRNILYVDEVNLLDDHLVDVLLDAAAMGQNIVEREGVSVAHPSRFILVGTMNPEEGELRPQLLDRFGLCVDVAGLGSIDQRVRVLEKVEAAAVAGLPGPGLTVEEDDLRDTIVGARRCRPRVRVPPPVVHFPSLLCVDAGALGHRADLVVSRTAQALRAWRHALEGSSSTAGPARLVDPDAEHGERPPLLVTGEDVISAAELALAHRRGPAQPDRAGGWSDVVQVAREQLEKLERIERPSSEPGQDAAAPPTAEQAGEGGEGGSRRDASGPSTGEPAPRGPETTPDSPLFTVRKIQLPRSRRSRKVAGKRTPTPSPDRRGRYVGSTQVERPTDVAMDATLRTAAPHQLSRRAEAPPDAPPMAVHVEPQDIRQKVRRRKTGTFIVFVVDASASMDAEQRMQATKGAVLSLLRDAYIRRDKVSLVVFSGRNARVVLQPTSSVDLAEQRLQRHSIGGTTPLTHGLAAGLRLVRSERLRDPAVYSLLVLISDGRGNISLFGEEPLVEAQRMASRLAEERVRVLVIDSARDHTRPRPLPRMVGRPPEPVPATRIAPGTHTFNPCQDLANRAGGEYLGLFDLSQGAIVEGVARTLRDR
ncbi:MAG: VWA domain-containing protein [Candidatus Dormibacteria bacterium]